MLDKVVSPKDGWKHNDPAFSDCDRQNAHSHLQATLLGHALSFQVAKGKLVLGPVPGHHRRRARRAPPPRPRRPDHRDLARLSAVRPGAPRDHPAVPAAERRAVPAHEPAAARLRAALPEDGAGRAGLAPHDRDGAAAAGLGGGLRGAPAGVRARVRGPDRRLGGPARRPLRTSSSRAWRASGSSRSTRASRTAWPRWTPCPRRSGEPSILKDVRRKVLAAHRPRRGRAHDAGRVATCPTRCS